MNWKEKLQSHGLTEDNAPNLVKKVIQERQELVDEVAKLKNTLKSEDLSDEQRKEIEEVIADTPNDIKEYDNKIIKKIEYWERMKDRWATAGERFKNSKGNKSAVKGTQVEEKQPNPEPPQPPQPPQQNVIEVEAEEIKPTKSSGISKVAVFILLGVLTFGAYNYLKNND